MSIKAENASIMLVTSDGVDEVKLINSLDFLFLGQIVVDFSPETKILIIRD